MLVLFLTLVWGSLRLAPINTKVQTNVATFECSFVFVTLISTFFATKHAYLDCLKMCKFYVKVQLKSQTVEKLTIKHKYLYLPYL